MQWTEVWMSIMCVGLGMGLYASVARVGNLYCVAAGVVLAALVLTLLSASFR